LSLNDHILCSEIKPWHGAFLKMDVRIRESANHESLGTYLAEQLFLSRFEVDTIEAEFMTFVEFSERKSPKFAYQLWQEIEALGVPGLYSSKNSANYEGSLRAQLEGKQFEPAVVDSALATVARFRQYLSRRLSLNLPSGENAHELRLGGMGELLAYLVANDALRHDCIYHKLVPDTRNAARHGVDLLTVRFGRNNEEDEVHWWEAKGTESSIPGQRDKIIEWFNSILVERVSTTIEAAKKEWLLRYGKDSCLRATTALSRFLLSASRYKYVGFLVFDQSHEPSDGILEPFSQISCPPENKLVVLFPLPELGRLVDEAFKTPW
jgi:hypothetical protein